MSKEYHHVELEQGTKTWHDWRRSGIGASDAPVIMGENPFKTLGALIQEKRDATYVRRASFSMVKGSALEPTARAAYCEKVSRQVAPACVQHVLRPWQRASLDGMSSCGTVVVEIKCGESVYRRTASFGRPPLKYYGQLQHILAVTGLQAIDFWCFLPRIRPIHLTVQRDEEYIARLIAAELVFWESYVKSQHTQISK